MKRKANTTCNRCASHAGSWYTDNSKQLNKQLSGWLNTATDSLNNNTYKYNCSRINAVKAIIAPHAGYSYSGPTAAWAYGAIDPNRFKCVFILGPSHHYYLSGCALSECDMYETPIGNLIVDKTINAELRSGANGDMFDTMTQDQDEEEHSIEMHLPYVAKVMESNKNFTIVPILVGSLNAADEIKFGNILQKYFDTPENLFIISSDFCHWGSRFSFQFYDRKFGEIYKSIEWLDHQGMSLIEKQDADGFREYLKKFRNTICGRNPICLLLHLINRSKLNFSVEFTKYAQSSQCKQRSDSSVSYASCIVTETNDGNSGQ
eukprot:g2057.t1